MTKRLLSVAGVAVLLGAVVSSAAAAAAGDGEKGASALFSVRASNGYRMFVVGSADRDDGRGEVSVFLARHGLRRLASYHTKGFVTDTRLKARFGRLGRIDLKLRSSGKMGTIRAPAPCNGTTERYEKSTYRGILQFRGEEGFTRARARRIAVSPQAWINLICSYWPVVATDGLEPGGVGAALSATATRGNRMAIEFEAAKNRPGERTLVTAVVAEKRGKMTVARGVQEIFGPAALEYDESLSTATVEPPAPFSGSATFRRAAGPAGRWRGDLRVDLPGRAGVSLNRPGFRTTLVPALWSFEPPEFR